MRLLLLSIVAVLAGCSTVKSYIPSFWDDNQAAYITSVRIDIERIDCSIAQKPQVDLVAWDLRRFTLYSEAKGSLQADVLRVVEPMVSTVKEWQTRGEGSKMYCDLKKQILTQQGERASKVILGRW